MSLEQDLQQEQVAHLNLSHFSSIEIGTSVKTTIEIMRAENHHCALITDSGPLVGIFTDHDILGGMVDDPDTWNLPIDDFITPDPKTINAKEPVDKALALMDDKHFRNIPVVDDDGNVVGNLTQYAIIEYLADRFPESVDSLLTDPNQVAPTRR